MAFMVPQYTNETFVGVYNDKNCEDTHVPQADLTLDKGDSVFETIKGKWWCRLSAPGYMDCTDWDGPHDTKEAARISLRDMWDIDPDTGDELGDDNS